MLPVIDCHCLCLDRTHEQISYFSFFIFHFSLVIGDFSLVSEGDSFTLLLLCGFDRCIEDSAELLVLVDQRRESRFFHQFGATDHFQPNATRIEFFQCDLQFVHEVCVAFRTARFGVIRSR